MPRVQLCKEKVPDHFGSINVGTGGDPDAEPRRSIIYPLNIKGNQFTQRSTADSGRLVSIAFRKELLDVLVEKHTSG